MRAAGQKVKEKETTKGGAQEKRSRRVLVESGEGGRGRGREQARAREYLEQKANNCTAGLLEYEVCP